MNDDEASNLTQERREKPSGRMRNTRESLLRPTIKQRIIVKIGSK